MKFNPDTPIVADLIAAAPSLVIALVVAWIAYQQLSTAKNKLATDLFDRRYLAWTALTNALEMYVAEVDAGRLRTDHAENDVFAPESLALINAERATDFLFGEDFKSKLDVLIELAMDYEPANSPPQYKGSNGKALSQATYELRAVAKKYMMLGHIGLTKPAKSRLFRIH